MICPNSHLFSSSFRSPVTAPSFRAFFSCSWNLICFFQSLVCQLVDGRGREQRTRGMGRAGKQGPTVAIPGGRKIMENRAHTKRRWKTQQRQQSKGAPCF